MKTIRMRLTLVYSAVILAALVITAFFLNRWMDRLFEQYAKDRQKGQISYVLDQIPKLYQEKSGRFDMQGIETAAIAALQNGLIVHVQTADLETDWDAKAHKHQESQEMLQHSEQLMHSKYPNFAGGYTEEKYSFTYGDGKTGYVIVGYYGPYALDDNELWLLGDINRSLFLLGGIFLVLVIVLTALLSRGITRPIMEAVKTAGEIAGGGYGVKINTMSRNEETQKLIDAINDMSEKLQTEEKQKRQITADVAHELRTPLSNLQGNLEAMLDGIWEPTHERLESCLEEIIRLASIVKQMQILYSLENNKDRLDCRMIDFYAMCQSLSADFERKLEENGTKLVVCVKKGDTVWGDGGKIRQCMVNLISNAVRYTHTDGTIEIHMRDDGQHTAVAVTDDGQGILQEELPHIFERFYRVDKSRNTKTGGMGIGLSITKAIVERHGGTISAESEYGKGTTFIMKFPKNCFCAQAHEENRFYKKKLLL